MADRDRTVLLLAAMWLLACGDDAGGGRQGESGDAAADSGVADMTADSGADDAGSGPRSGELLALTYNVAGLPEPLSGSMPERFMPLIGPLLNDYELVLMQETWLTPDPNPGAPLRVYHEILVEASEHPYQSEPAEVPWGMDARRPTALLGDGLNRFSDLPFDDVIRVPWEDCVETASDCLAFKGFSMARTELADAVSVDVYNLHMEAGGSAEDEAARAAGITQLVDFMQDMSEGRAVIVGGDFNLHTDTEPAATQYQELLDTAGLTDACEALDCDFPGSIDKFAYRSSDELEIEALQWSDESDTFVSDMGEDLSDHPPIAVRFGWTLR
jgi:hypothetical protein